MNPSEPMHLRRGHSLSGLFAVRADLADRRLADAGLTAARFAPGRAVLSLVATRHLDGDLGPYDEIALSLLARPSTRRRPAALVGDRRAITNGGGARVPWRVGVTTEVARDAAEQTWGLPASLERIEVDVLAGRATVTWRDRDQLVLRYALEADGEIGRRRPGGELELGQHPIADELRELGVTTRARHGSFHGQPPSRPGPPSPM